MTVAVRAILRAPAVAAGLLVAASAAGDALALDRIWYAEVTGDGGAAAVYGVPETDDRVLRLACNPATPDAVEIDTSLVGPVPQPSGTDVLFNVDGASFERFARTVEGAGDAGYRVILVVNRLDPLMAALVRGRYATFAHQPPRPGELPVEVNLHRSAAVVRSMFEAC